MAELESPLASMTKVYALTIERDTLHREQNKRSDATALLKEKDDIITQVMEEGQKLSKKQVVQESTIRKLRAQAEENKVENLKSTKAATEKLLNLCEQDLLVPSLAAARAGKSKFIIGDGTNMYDFTYVENVAHAHVCAERALASDGSASKRAAGEAYFITNMQPIKFWEFMSLILVGLGFEWYILDFWFVFKFAGQESRFLHLLQ
ncbi:hypothetical protein Lser_V15G10877 [Lactuca serriola]